MKKLHYKRILVKVSGEQLAGAAGRGVDPEVAKSMATEINKAVKKGAEVVVMIGGGNIVRGRDVAGSDIAEATGHYMGMLATMINGLALADIFNAQGLTTRVVTSIQMDLVADFYTRRRALHQLRKGRVLVQIGGTGRPYVTTDTAAVSLALDLECDVVCKVTKVDGVYDKDPMKFSDAKRLESVSFAEALRNPDVKVMDKAAIGMAMETGKKIVVCDLDTSDNLVKLVIGKDVGTLIS